MMYRDNVVCPMLRMIARPSTHQPSSHDFGDDGMQVFSHACRTCTRSASVMAFQNVSMPIKLLEVRC
jgi:hypothetical protein